MKALADLYQLDKKHIWHPFTQMGDWEKEENLIIEKGQGIYLYDLKGRKYIDGVSSLWVNIHGHNHPYLNKAIQQQLKKIAHSTLLGLGNMPSIDLAEYLIDIVPKGLTKVFYSDSGSTAMEIALKMAYQYWQQEGQSGKKKTKFLTFGGAYHGDTIGAVSLGGIDLFHRVYKPLLFETISLPSPYHHFNYQPTMDYSLYLLEQELKKKNGEVAALVIEPLIQGAAGIHQAPDGLLAGVAELCRKYQVLLIADEVAVGFGRTGKMFGCEHEKVTPDIMAIAKGLTGGYLPLAATLTTERIYDNFKGDYSEQKTFFHGHSYTGNPLACSVAVANIELFGRDNTIAKMQAQVKYLQKSLTEIAELPHVGQVRQKGLMAAIELVKNKKTKEEYDWAEKIGVKVMKSARAQGLIIRPLENNIVIMPPLVIKESELKQMMQIIRKSIITVTGK